MAAIRAGILGLETALIEKDPLLGGTCLHRGCIPTKALLQTAALHDEINRSAEFGIKIDGVSVDFPKVQNRKKKIVRKLAKGIEYLMKKRKVDVMTGAGTLIGASTVSVRGEAGEERINARKIIIATGSVPASLPHIVPDGLLVLNSDHVLELREIPRRLAVVGAGAVGVEFASIFASFGTEVSIIELLPRILPIEDEEISLVLAKSLESRGMKISTSSEVKSAEKTPGGVNLVVRSGDADEEIEVDKVLVSVGRKPLTDGIGLEEVGVETEGGYIKVDEFMQTNVPGIYAIGDIVRSPQLAHVASAEGILAVNHLAGRPVEGIDYKKIPSCTYCRPEVASVGLTEKQAVEAGYDVAVGRFPFQASGKASILGEPEGLVKIVADKKYDEVLGVHIVGPKATELIAEAGAALNLEATVESITHTIHAHPTLSEAMLEAAHDVYGEAIHI